MFEYGTLERSGGAHRFEELTFTFIDFETTGHHPSRGARVCEIAIVKRHGDGTRMDEWSTLIDPEKPIRNSEYHGITSADVRGAPTFGEVAATVAGYMDQSIVVAHQAEYNERFLTTEFSRLEGAATPTSVPALCTLVLARAQLDLRSHRLDSLVYFTEGMGMGMNQHNAIVDARATADVLRQLACEGPHRLHWKGPSTGHHIDRSPVYRNIRPRVDPDKLSKYDLPWLVTAVNRLPALADPAPVGDEDKRQYLGLVRTALDAGPLTRERLRPIAAAMTRLGLTQSSARSLHVDLFEEILADADAGRLPKGSKLASASRIAAELGQAEQTADRPSVRVRSGPLKGKRLVVLGSGDDLNEVRRIAEEFAATVQGEKTRRFDTLWAVVTGSGLEDDHPIIKGARDSNVPVWNPAQALENFRTSADAPPPRAANQVEAPAEREWQRFWRPSELKAAEYRIRYIDPFRDKRGFRAWRSLAGPTGSTGIKPDDVPHVNHAKAAETEPANSGCAVVAVLVLGGAAGLLTAAATTVAMLTS